MIDISEANLKEKAVTDEEILEGVERFKKEHADAYRILKELEEEDEDAK